MKKKAYHHGDLKNALVDAGMEILNSEGLAGLSLRSVAQKAGVSHSAPYAHFKDKQALIAAISTEGLRKLYKQLSAVVKQHEEHPLDQLYELAWAYVDFALDYTGLFKVIFSSAIEREHDYPEFVEVSPLNFDLSIEVVKNNQASGHLKPGDPNLLATGIWSMVHGFIFLSIEKQIPSRIRNQHEIKSLLTKILDQFIISANQ